jgi:hypothetical protein
MTNLTKYLAIACLLSLAGLFVSISTCNKEMTSRQVEENNVAASRDTIRMKTDKEGNLHATIEAQAGTIKEMQGQAVLDLDSASKLLQVKQNKIEGLQKVNARLVQNYSALVDNTKHGDTVSTVTHESPFNEFTEVRTIDSATGQETAHIADTSIVPITLVETVKGDGFFRPQLHFVDGSSANKAVKITGLSSVLIVKEKPKVIRAVEVFGIGLLTGIVIHTFVH